MQSAPRIQPDMQIDLPKMQADPPNSAEDICSHRSAITQPPKLNNYKEKFMMSSKDEEPLFKRMELKGKRRINSLKNNRMTASDRTSSVVDSKEFKRIVSISLRHQGSLHIRKDRKGIAISKGSKKHRITFRDEIDIDSVSNSDILESAQGC